MVRNAMGMPITIIPSSVLEDIAADWQDSTPAANIFGGKITGQINLLGSLILKGSLFNGHSVEPACFLTSADSRLEDFAMMLWLSRRPQIGDSTICRCWDDGYGIGANTLKNGALIQLLVPEESVELLSTRQLLNQYGLKSIEELEVCEELLEELEELYEEQLEEDGIEPADFISDFAQGYVAGIRVDVRDELQQAFLNAIHNSY